MTQKTIIVNGEEVPVYPAKAEEEVLEPTTQDHHHGCFVGLTCQV